MFDSFQLRIGHKFDQQVSSGRVRVSISSGPGNRANSIDGCEVGELEGQLKGMRELPPKAIRCIRCSFCLHRNGARCTSTRLRALESFEQGPVGVGIWRMVSVDFSD